MWNTPAPSKRTGCFWATSPKRCPRSRGAERLRVLLPVPGFSGRLPGELAAAAKRLRFPLDWFYSDRLVKTFSGGEKVKLRMALLTLGRPDCYLLDEPSNDLDIDTLDWLETFIRECAQPVLFISHDELLLERTANVILHMEQLRRKTLPAGPWPAWATASTWRSGCKSSPTRNSWPARSGRRSANSRNASRKSNKRWSTS